MVQGLEPGTLLRHRLSGTAPGPTHRSHQGSKQLPLMLVQTLGGTLLEGVLLTQLLEKALLPGQPHLGQRGDGAAAESQPPEG